MVTALLQVQGNAKVDTCLQALGIAGDRLSQIEQGLLRVAQKEVGPTRQALRAGIARPRKIRMRGAALTDTWKPGSLTSSASLFSLHLARSGLGSFKTAHMQKNPLQQALSPGLVGL